MDQKQVFRRLCRGGPFDDLDLLMHEGRCIVHGLRLPTMELPRRLFGLGDGLRFVSDRQHFKRKTLEGVEFHNCDFTELALSRSTVRNCVFKNCKLEGIFIYRSRISNCVFHKCSLRDTAFGGNNVTWPVPPNEFDEVMFDQCDFRGSAHGCVLYTACSFRQCSFKTTFPGAVFTNCSFEGRLDEVIFHGQNLDFPKMPPNLMAGCDLSTADIRHCRFVDMSVNPAIFGENQDVLILWNGPEDWRRWLEGGHIECTEGNCAFVEIMIDGRSRPDVASRSNLSELFTQKEIEALESISQGVL